MITKGPKIDRRSFIIGSAALGSGLALGLNGPHVVDTMLWLMDDVPVKVYAQTSRMKPQQWEGEDQATLVLTFRDGSIATGHVSLNMRPEANERWIVGPQGVMHLTNDRTLTLRGERIVTGAEGAYIDGDESFDGQFREFALAIREGRQPQACATQVRAVVEVLAAALQSAAAGQPVSLPLARESTH